MSTGVSYVKVRSQSSSKNHRRGHELSETFSPVPIHSIEHCLSMAYSDRLNLIATLQQVTPRHSEIGVFHYSNILMLWRMPFSLSGPRLELVYKFQDGFSNDKSTFALKGCRWIVFTAFPVPELMVVSKHKKILVFTVVVADSKLHLKTKVRVMPKGRRDTICGITASRAQPLAACVYYKVGNKGPVIVLLDTTAWTATREICVHPQQLLRDIYKDVYGPGFFNNSFKILFSADDTRVTLCNVYGWDVTTVDFMKNDHVTIMDYGKVIVHQVLSDPRLHSLESCFDLELESRDRQEKELLGDMECLKVCVNGGSSDMPGMFVAYGLCLGDTIHKDRDKDMLLGLHFVPEDEKKITKTELDLDFTDSDVDLDLTWVPDMGLFAIASKGIVLFVFVSATRTAWMANVIRAGFLFQFSKSK